MTIVNNILDLAEQAFKKWQTDNYLILAYNAPTMPTDNSPAIVFDNWCRQVYTGRINILTLVQPPTEE